MCECVGKRVYEFSSLYSLLYLTHSLFLSGEFNVRSCWTPSICNITDIAATALFHFFSLGTIKNECHLFWFEVSKVLFIDSSGCLCLIQPSNKKWTIYARWIVKIGKSTKVPLAVFAFKLWALLDKRIRRGYYVCRLKIDIRRRKLCAALRTCKCTNIHTFSHWYTMELFKYSQYFWRWHRIYREKWIFVCWIFLSAQGEN